MERLSPFHRYRSRTISVNWKAALALVIGSALTFGLTGCAQTPNTTARAPIGGAWYTRVAGAPFEYQMYLFNADGTMQESNPDAGDAHTSDSAGYGAWTGNGNTVTAKFVEVTADRRTRAFASRGEVSFELTVDDDHLTGTATGRFYDTRGKLIVGPVHATIDGTRVRP